MPRFDSTGPQGMGPMTGGGRGYCAVPLSVPRTELDSLKKQVQDLKAHLEQVKNKIEQLEKYRE